ncbi:SPFH domain-containing protein [Baaleninema simplex]|uniref:SPFH domain-containing protein n=1 Tax=Baaleninema simplex TaxID=2862350 RepID=UPI00034569CA|nr:SPFH domain-containing protein [Baaleninema simplex]
MKLLKKTLIGFALSTVALSGCTAIIGERVPAGYVGLLINQYGSEERRGIDNAEFIEGGRAIYNPVNQELVLFPTFVNKYSFTNSTIEQSPVPEAIGFSVAGTSVEEDVAIGVMFDKANDGEFIKTYYSTYRLSPEEFVRTHLRDEVRGCFNRAVVDADIQTPFQYQNQRIDLLNRVETCIADSFNFLIVQNLEYLGKPQYPPNIQAAIDEQFEAEQRAKSAEARARQAEAEAQAEIAKARGEAEAEKIRASVANDPNYLRYRQLEIEMARIQRWNGQEAPIVQTPNVQLGAAGNPQPQENQ